MYAFVCHCIVQNVMVQYMTAVMRDIVMRDIFFPVRDILLPECDVTMRYIVKGKDLSGHHRSRPIHVGAKWPSYINAEK